MCMVSAIDNFERNLAFINELVIKYDDRLPFGYSSSFERINSQQCTETVFIVPYVAFPKSLNGTVYPEVCLQAWAYCPSFMVKLREVQRHAL